MQFEPGPIDWIPNSDLNDGDLFVIEDDDGKRFICAAVRDAVEDDEGAPDSAIVLGEQGGASLDGDEPYVIFRRSLPNWGAPIGRVRGAIARLGTADGRASPGKGLPGALHVSQNSAWLYLRTGGVATVHNLATGRIERPPAGAVNFRDYRFGYMDGDKFVALATIRNGKFAKS